MKVLVNCTDPTQLLHCQLHGIRNNFVYEIEEDFDQPNYIFIMSPDGDSVGLPISQIVLVENPISWLVINDNREELHYVSCLGGIKTFNLSKESVGDLNIEHSLLRYIRVGTPIKVIGYKSLFLGYLPGGTGHIPKIRFTPTDVKAMFDDNIKELLTDDGKRIGWELCNRVTISADDLKANLRTMK